MRAVVFDYLREVAKTWWARVGLIAGLVGLASDLGNLSLPTSVLWVIVAVGALLAQFTAFRRVRLERDELAAELAAARAPQDPRAFVPDLLDGRLHPTSEYPVLESNERGFVVRTALAFALDHAYEPLGSKGQQGFNDAVAGSALEGWFQAQTDVIGRVPAEQWWERIHPTRSDIVTVSRAPARLPHYEFTLAGHCVLSLRPGIQPVHPGYGLLIASATFRPIVETENAIGEWPLSFEDLYEMLSLFQAAVVDQIATDVLPAVVAGAWQPRALAVLAIANGGKITDYVLLDRHRWSPAPGLPDPSALYGRVSTEHAARDAASRDVEIKRWLARFLSDAGLMEFEADLRHLQPPKIPKPLPA